MKTFFLTAMLLLGGIFYAQAQTTNSKWQNYPLRVVLADESISLPNFWFTNYSFNPSIQVGTEHIFKQKERSNWALLGNVGFYYHKNWQAALTLTSGIGYRRNFGRFNINPRLELGYAQVWETNAVYQIQDGQPKKVTNLGTPLGTAALSLNVGYALKDEPRSPEVFLTFGSSVELPFRLPTGAHQTVGIGVQFYPF